MKIEILHDDQDARVEVSPAQKLLRLTWKQPNTGEAYRSLLSRVIDVVGERQLKLWLSDGRKAGPILYEDQVWTTQEFMPRVLAAGLVRIAIVNSEDGLNLMAVDRMVNATPADAPYSIGFFEDPSIGQLWLMDPSKSKVGKSVPPSPSSTGD